MWFCTETVNNLFTQLISNKKATKLMQLRCFFLAKIVANYALLVCKIIGPKIRSCKFFCQISSLDIIIKCIHLRMCLARNIMIESMLIRWYTIGGQVLPLWDRLGNHYSLAPTLIHKLTPWSILPKPKNEHNVFLCHDTAKKVTHVYVGRYW